jgi:hypothetical protein
MGITSSLSDMADIVFDMGTLAIINRSNAQKGKRSLYERAFNMKKPGFIRNEQH